jgi:hypothetical protein
MQPEWIETARVWVFLALVFAVAGFLVHLMKPELGSWDGSPNPGDSEEP